MNSIQRLGRMMVVGGMIVGVTLLLNGTVSSENSAAVKQASTQTDKTAAKVCYQCPMHPSVIQDHPGKCPQCGMGLEKTKCPQVAKEKKTDKSPVRKPSKKRKAAEVCFQCPMHPSVVQDHPGKCPQCGMDLEKVACSSIKKAEGKKADNK